jgi:hypothetical protein
MEIPDSINLTRNVTRAEARAKYPGVTLPGEFFYVDNNTSGTISIRSGDNHLRPGKSDQEDDPIILNFLSDTNRAQSIAHRMNLDHWSVKEPKYAEPKADGN